MSARTPRIVTVREDAAFDEDLPVAIRVARMYSATSGHAQELHLSHDEAIVLREQLDAYFAR